MRMSARSFDGYSAVDLDVLPPVWTSGSDENGLTRFTHDFDGILDDIKADRDADDPIVDRRVEQQHQRAGKDHVEVGDHIRAGSPAPITNSS